MPFPYPADRICLVLSVNGVLQLDLDTFAFLARHGIRI